jgi:hypothetical protein
MPKVKLCIVEGFGTNNNPYLSGTERTVETEVTLNPSENIRSVVVYDFEPEEDGGVRVSPDVLPVIPPEFINNLVGKLLTVSDAAFSDPEQRRAFKDLLTQSVWMWYQGQGKTTPA